MQHERYTYKATWLVWKKDFKKGLFFYTHYASFPNYGHKFNSNFFEVSWT